jgi:hypothetical protein
MLTTEGTEEITEKHVVFDLHDLLNVLGSIFFEPQDSTHRKNHIEKCFIDSNLRESLTSYL